MSKGIKLIVFLSLLLVVFSSVALAIVDEQGNLKIENDYISIFVNQNESNRGRFAIDITGGAPMRDGDDGKPLIYGRPNPWTSYTTIKIDDTNYVFGGPTEKRAGEGSKYGELVQEPTIEDNRIVTKYKYGQIFVTQILSFVKSTTTGLPDTAEIRYRITNQGEETKEVGTRVMIDTMLGENDGAPFRIRNKAITSDKSYTASETPHFWQAFDSLDDPKVTAQGTIKGPGLTTPDKVYFSDWGSFADGIWDFDFNPGEKFLRKGEFELDSAMALLWDPEELAPGETKDYVSNYGLGGITIVPGLLSLGITSPAELVMDQADKKAQIVAYVQNTAEITAEDVKVELELPSQLELSSDKLVKELQDMKPGSTAQVMWEVSPNNQQPKELDYKVKVTAENTDDNQVTRGLRVVGPPDLGVDIEAPGRIKADNNQLAQEEFKIYGAITNVGNSTAYGVNSMIALPPGLEIAKGEKEEKFLGKLKAGETVKVPWLVEPIGIINGDLSYSVEIDTDNAGQKSVKDSISFPELTPKIKIDFDEQSVMVGDYLTANVKLENITDFYQINFDLRYNKYALEPVYVSRGSLFVDNDKLLSFNHPQLDELGYIKELSASLDSPEELKRDTVAKIHFKVLSTGSPNFRFENLDIYNSEQYQINLKSEIESIILEEE
ncbi:MAG: cohesin domain-containing protein [Bacillota bacterium]